MVIGRRSWFVTLGLWQGLDRLGVGVELAKGVWKPTQVCTRSWSFPCERSITSGTPFGPHHVWILTLGRVPGDAGGTCPRLHSRSGGWFQGREHCRGRRGEARDFTRRVKRALGNNTGSRSGVCSRGDRHRAEGRGRDSGGSDPTWTRGRRHPPDTTGKIDEQSLTLTLYYLHLLSCLSYMLVVDIVLISYDCLAIVSILVLRYI